MTTRVANITILLSGGGFLLILLLMQFDPGDFVLLDAAATTLAHPFQTLPWIEFFVAITTLGSTTGIVAIAVLAAVLLPKDPRTLRRLVVLLVGESVSVQLVKTLIGRIRPDALPSIGILHSFSFPSGHATASAALFGFIACIALPQLSERWERNGLIAFMMLLILMIGISRIVLAAHYASDVLAGYLLGVWWIAFVFRFVR